MKKFKFSKVSKIILAFVFTLGLAGIIYAVVLPTTPDLGDATTFGVLSTTFTHDVGTTTVTGDVGYAGTKPSISGSGAYTVSGGTDYGPDAPYATAGSDQGIALTNLNDQYTADCTLLGGGGAVNLDNVLLHTTGHYTPGCYYSDGAMNITVNQTITLDGDGTYIFKALGALTTQADTEVILNGASACDVFWTPTEATTIGAYTTTGVMAAEPTFVGTIIDDAGITIGHFANLLGRALSFASTVTTDTNVITVPTCATPATLNVIKHVSGGTASAGDWVLTVASSDIGSGTGYADGVESPGTPYTLETGHQYSVTENAGPSGYTSSLSDECTIDNAEADTIYNCTITNTYTPVHHSSVIGSIARTVVSFFDFEPTITILSTPVVVNPIVKAVVPTLPVTGFPPQSENTSWYKIMSSFVVNFFK